MIKPTGTVTFLFTDIEGSTKLSQDFPDTYHDLLERHNEILQNAVESVNGFVFKTVGDAFCCAFQKTEDAIRAAVQAQKKFNSENRDDTFIKVRMGIHKGNAEWVGNDYMGYITLARTSRIMSAANGSQVLISDDAYESVKEFIEMEISFRDLGERRLKDLIQPMKLYQILSDGILSEFPPLQTLDARPNNLPVQLTSFIGREKEMADIKKILKDSRLVTLLGSGGSGKTSLAMHVGADVIDSFAGGVFISEFANVSDPSLIRQTLMNTLGINEAKGQSPDKTLTEYIKDREMLLIFDNCEHLIHDCASLAEMLLSSCPDLKIIATSREAFNSSGEKTYRVPSLSHPDPNIDYTPEKLNQYESVRLFIERALVLNQNFMVTNENAPALAQICFQLDGIPLAIELAAARIKVLSVEGINERLNDRFKLLTGGKRTALPRQQTLKAMIDWSYNLLSEKEKILFQRLTIFTGGWTMESAEEICSDEMIDEYEFLDLMENLSDKSLIKVVEKTDGFRYTMLETIKKYGDELLSGSGKKSELMEKHFMYFKRFADKSDERLTGSNQKEWVKRFDSEIGNLRDSLNWSLKNKPESALMMSVNMTKFWEIRSYFSEALEFLRKSSEQADTSDSLLKANALHSQGLFNIYQGNYSDSKKLLEKCLKIFRELNNKDGEAKTLLAIGTIALFESDYEKLNILSEESLKLSEEIKNKSYSARIIQNLAVSLMQKGEFDSARDKFNESLSFYRELNDTVQIAKIIGNIGVLEFWLRNFDKARIAYEESLQVRIEMGDRHGTAIALTNLGAVAISIKEYEEAERLIGESLQIIRELGDKRIIVTTLTNLGMTAFYRRDFSKAVKLFRESAIIANELRDLYSLAKGIEGFANTFIELKMYPEGCIASANYVSLINESNLYIIEEEVTRIKEIKIIFSENLSETDYKLYWEKGENMNFDEILEYLDSIPVENEQNH